MTVQELTEPDAGCETAVVREYFELASGQDVERYLALFATAATAHDEGREHRGIGEIRSWRKDLPPVSYDVRDIRGTGDDLEANVEISGTFPGSPSRCASCSGSPTGTSIGSRSAPEDPSAADRMKSAR